MGELYNNIFYWLVIIESLNEAIYCLTEESVLLGNLLFVVYDQIRTKHVFYSD